MDHKTVPGPKQQSKKNVPNPTLENVAEEVLNGMMCHYEPPDPKRFRRQVKRGILRQPTVAGGKKQQQQAQKGAPRNRVRWEDEKVPTVEGKAAATDASKQDPPTMNPVCGGFGQVCYDAGIEAGCVPDSSNPKKKQMNATEAIAVAKAKSPRNNRSSDEELVFDEEGNLTYSNPKKKGLPPPPPPPPPPPRERELFMPQLCGVRIKCGDDDVSNDPPLPALASPSSSFDTSNLVSNLASPKRSSKEDDETNSLLDDEEDEAEDPDKQPVVTRKESPKAATRKTTRKKIEWVDFAELKESIDDWESHSPASSFFRRVFPLKKTIEKKAVPTRRNSMDSSSEGDSDTSERRGRHASRGRSRSRSRSPFRRNKSKEGDVDKVDRYHDRSMSPDALARSDTTASKQKKFGFKFLKGVSPRSKKLSSEGDWDDSIPIVPPSFSDPPRTRGRSRSRSPKHLEIKQTRSHSPLQQRTRILPISDARDLPPLPEGGLQTLHPQITYPAFHPAHPLKQQQQRGGSGHSDDEMERMSFITANREGFENRPPHMGTQNSICGMAAPQVEDFDRQSFITSHRQAFDSSVPSAPYPGQQLVPAQISDDALERQSFITAHRQGFARGDDSDERQSFITAHRQAFDPVKVHNPGPVLNRAAVDLATMGPLTLSPGREPSPRRGRSRAPRRSRSPSPRRRSRSPSQKDQNTEHDPNHMMPMSAPPVMIYDPRTGMHHLPPPGYLPPVYEYPQSNPIQQFYAQQAMKGQLPIPYQHGPISTKPSQECIHCGPPGIPQTISGVSAQPVMNGSSSEPDRQEAVKEEELSWEERTRLAWERIRGGVEAAFNMEPTKPDGVEKDEDAENVQNPSPEGTLTSPEKRPQSPDKQIHESPPKQQSTLQPRSPISIVQQRVGSPQSILRTPSSEMRRVTFGEAQERIFYDDQDENRSQMTYPDPNRKKKKKRFRGTKLISGVLGKMKNTAGKVNSALSKSTDSESSSIYYSSSSSSPSQDSAAHYGDLQAVLSEQSSASSQQRYSNRQPQSQDKQVNPLREKNGRNA